MMTFQNGEIYCGAWLRDLRHGEGVHTFVDGSRYEGMWENDSLHGKGIFYYSDGSVFAGQFDSNKRHGPGASYCFVCFQIVTLPRMLHVQRRQHVRDYNAIPVSLL
jgi:hypothetical protein